MKKLQVKSSSVIANGEMQANGNESIAANSGISAYSWKPGQSGNPSGRPKSKLVTDAYRAILEEHGADELAAVVYRDAIQAKRANDRLAAIQEITDRVEGKAVQAHRLSGDLVDGQTASVLAELASRLAPTINIAVISSPESVNNRPLILTDETAKDGQENQ